MPPAEPGRVRRGYLRPALVGTLAALALIAVLMSGLPFVINLLVAVGVPIVAVYALVRQPEIRRLWLPMQGQLKVEAGSGATYTGPVRALFSSPFWCAFRVDDPAGRSPVIGLFPDELDSASWRRLLVAMRSD